MDWIERLSCMAYGLGARLIEKPASFLEQICKLCDILFEHLGGRWVKETAGHSRIAISGSSR